jgi:hypothetical protein
MTRPIQTCEACEKPTTDYELIPEVDGGLSAYCRDCVFEELPGCEECGGQYPESWLTECDECGMVLCHECLEDGLTCKTNTAYQSNPAYREIAHQGELDSRIADKQRAGYEWWPEVPEQESGVRPKLKTAVSQPAVVRKEKTA